ncbi:MAG: LPS assembly protein LptD [Terracidiphilus sp.]|nr:LPS assembly protein LptD [Terracidiphilus sp.]
MRPRTLLFITLLALCHLQLRGQALTNPAPVPQTTAPAAADEEASVSLADLPSDPGQELLPLAEPEPEAPSGMPGEWTFDSLQGAGDTVTLTGHVVFRYRGYILRADHVVYHRNNTQLEADGNLEVTGGAENVHISASHGDMRLNMHTARFYNVTGSQGIHTNGRASVYSTTNPFLFTARVLLQTGEGKYRLIDGSMTNCNLPRPDWRVISRAIKLEDGKASTQNSFFQFLNVPIFYIPYLRHPVDETGRESGLLVPVVSNSSIKGFIVGAQVYTVLNRSMDMVVGAEFFSERGWAPNGDFRYRGNGLDHLMVRWNALLDRGVRQKIVPPTTAGGASPNSLPVVSGTHLVNQGGVDIVAEGRKDFGVNTHVAGSVDYLSSYLYRLVFNDNFTQAISSQVSSKVGLTHVHKGYVPSLFMDRFETFASSATGDEARILHLPSLRFDVVDQPMGPLPLYWSLGSSLSYMSRSEPRFHARNIGRMDFYPHVSLPFSAGGWNFVPGAALRETAYSISQHPDLTDLRHGVPTISHDPLNRSDAEASLDIRPPAFERDYVLPGFNRVLRHVVESELNYRFVGGIGSSAQRVALVDTSDIATDTNEAGFSITQRFYLKPLHAQPCESAKGTDHADQKPAAPCSTQPREWASWQIAQKYFIDPEFGGALIRGRRNVFDTTLDLTGVAFLTTPEKRSPIISRMRFEAIDNLRVEWDVDYDPLAGQFSADNMFAGYTKGRTTVGLGHALLNAVDESRGSASTIKSQQLQPFLMIGKPSKSGFNLAANGGYDFVLGQMQYAGVQTNYNWDCCGLTFGYRRFRLGTVRDETQYLYSFTLANFGSVGDIRRSNSVFRDPALAPAF